MNTFLPSADFEVCAFVLDNRRLNKQIVEGMQLCRLIIARRSGVLQGGFANHPVLKLWESDEGRWLLPELVEYIDTLARQWQTRPTVRKKHKWFEYAEYFKGVDKRRPGSVEWPAFVYMAMRRNLIRKDLTHYTHYFRLAKLPIEEPMEGYFWEHPIWSSGS